MIITGKDYEWDSVTVNIGGEEIKCTPFKHNGGITCISYKNGKRKVETVSHKEYALRERKLYGAKKIRISRKKKKIVNKTIAIYIPEIAKTKLSPYKRIITYNSIFGI